MRSLGTWIFVVFGLLSLDFFAIVLFGTKAGAGGAFRVSFYVLLAALVGMLGYGIYGEMRKTIRR